MDDLRRCQAAGLRRRKIYDAPSVLRTYGRNGALMRLAALHAIYAIAQGMLKYACDVHRFALSAVVDLMPAARSVRDD